MNKNEQPILEITHTDNFLQSVVKKGQKETLEGWYSDAFGNVVPAPRLVFTGELETGQEVNIIFKPHH